MSIETREHQADRIVQSRRCPICDGPAETLWCLHEFTYGAGDDAVETRHRLALRSMCRVRL